jgi:ribosomal protein S18 acetylase RimI-like enzyme
LNMFQNDWLSDIQVRIALESDLQALEWDGEFTHFRRLYRQIFDSMLEGKAIIWVVDLHQVGLIGQLFLQLISNRPELADGVQRGYIYGFRVKPAFRRHGLGSKMLEWAENDLQNRKFSWITLNVSRENSGAQKFYRRHGYQVVANEPGEWSYLDHEGVIRKVFEPAFRMEKCIKQEVRKS